MSHLIRVSSKVYLLPRSRQLLVPCQGIEQFQQKRNFSFKEQFVGFINALPEYYAATLNSGVVQSIAHGYGSIHDATGLPWWAVILGTSALFRISTLLPAQTTSRKV